MNLCTFSTHTVAEMVHSPVGTKGIFITNTIHQANALQSRLFSSAKRYDAKLTCKTYILVDQKSNLLQRQVIVTITQAGRALKKRGKTPLFLQNQAD